jgi:hypothetical protein
MIWEYTKPVDGQTRVRKVFNWFPKTLPKSGASNVYQTRWLRKSYIFQRFDMSDWFYQNGSWTSICWVGS